MTDFKLKDQFNSKFDLDDLRIMVSDAPHDLAVEGLAFFQLTPDQARKLAAQLLENAAKQDKANA